ncbi:MAG: type II toxin-antitoxin system PemK/MazF family toxin [Dehalococcoidia bacterium]
MNRGEVWWINFNPSVGGETRKKRPAIIISNDASNRHLNRLQVIPITSNVERLYPSEAFITINNKQHKSLADQLTTVSKLRMINQFGKVSREDMWQVERAIKVQLALLDDKQEEL